MPDLIDKFFAEDLTEAEQDALSEILSSSDEAALKFEETAKQAYFRYGFPEPQPRWKDSPPSSLPPPSGLGPWLWPAMFVVGAMLAVGWRTHFLFPRTLPHFMALLRPSSDVVTKTESPIYPSKAAITKPVLSIQRKQSVEEAPLNSERSRSNQLVVENPRDRAMTRVLVESPVSPQAKTAVQAVAPPAALSQQGVTPVNLDLNPPQTFSNLSVVVGQSQLGFLTVRVVDGRDGEIKLLYRGNLSPGNWSFEWDGKLLNGQAAAPGYYKIEVRSGSVIQRKAIQIQ